MLIFTKNMDTKKVLVAGATGYLGQYLVKELKKRDFWVRVLIRKEAQKAKFEFVDDYFVGQATEPDSIKKITKDVDAVISAVGITRQKDGLTYMDVDYQANVNLLNEAKKSGVKKFIYISVLNGEKLRHLKICEAKEKLGDYLKSSGLDYCIIRPNGFFSDMSDFLNMAKGGKVYLFGDGKLKLNPIHGKDLAKSVVDAINQDGKEINIGGPEMLSQNEIAELALKACGKSIKIVHLPDWIRKFALWSVRTFTSSKTYGPIEFFMTTMVMDMQAPQFGKHKLEDFFNEEVKKQKQ